ncbi:MAG: DNA polymerase III subunit delta [Ignavibacteria bacterium]|nr:DNA polymerase III subunit delta [Ignavibacteria bacterium]
MINDIISSKKFPPVLLLFGAEDFLVELDAKKLYDAACALDATGMNCDVLDGEQTSLDSVLSIARSYPMMSEQRVIWVRRADKMSASKGKKSSDNLAQYLAAPNTTTFLLFTASLPSANGIGSRVTRNAAAAAKKINALKYPFPLLLQKASWSEYPQLKEQQAMQWVSRRAADSKIALPATAPEIFISRCGNSLRDLSMELEKLKLYVGDRTEVTEKDVFDVIGSSREFNVFELQRAIGRADAAAAMKIATAMMTADSQELPIIAMLSRFFLQLYKLIDMRLVPDQAMVSEQTGIPTWTLGEHFDYLDRLGPIRVERAIHVLREAERTVKSTSTPPLLIVQMLISRILDSK